MNIHDPQTMKDDVSSLLILKFNLHNCPYYIRFGMILSTIFLFKCLTGFLTPLQEPLLKIELNNPALLAGNWTQLCATCKVPAQIPFYVFLQS
jgi:hypothetical protein